MKSPMIARGRPAFLKTWGLQFNNETLRSFNSSNTYQSHHSIVKNPVLTKVIGKIYLGTKHLLNGKAGKNKDMGQI